MGRSTNERQQHSRPYIFHEDNLISSVDVGEKLGKSDHNIVRFKIESNFSFIKKSFSRLDFKRANFVNLRMKVTRIPISILENTESKWHSFKTSFMKNQLMSIPFKEISPSGLQKPKWFNNSISVAIGIRQKAYRTYYYKTFGGKQN